MCICIHLEDLRSYRKHKNSVAFFSMLVENCTHFSKHLVHFPNLSREKLRGTTVNNFKIRVSIYTIVNYAVKCNFQLRLYNAENIEHHACLGLSSGLYCPRLNR